MTRWRQIRLWSRGSSTGEQMALELRRAAVIAPGRSRAVGEGRCRAVLVLALVTLACAGCAPGTNDHGRAVFQALRDGDSELATQLVLEYGDARHRDEQGATLLHLAVTAGDLSLVRALVETGADVNAEDRDGFRPLDMVIFSDGPSSVDAIIAYLQEHGARGRLVEETERIRRQLQEQFQREQREHREQLEGGMWGR